MPLQIMTNSKKDIKDILSNDDAGTKSSKAQSYASLLEKVKQQFVTGLLLKCYWVTKIISIFAIGNKIKT